MIWVFNRNRPTFMLSSTLLPSIALQTQSCIFIFLISTRSRKLHCRLQLQIEDVSDVVTTSISKADEDFNPLWDFHLRYVWESQEHYPQIPVPKIHTWNGILDIEVNKALRMEQAWNRHAPRYLRQRYTSELLPFLFHTIVLMIPHTLQHFFLSRKTAPNPWQ